MAKSKLIHPRMLRVVVASAAILPAGACAELGYRDRVLHAVTSPDGQFVAVCQEVPAFDGPGYTVRLERPDGARVRPLYGIGDGDPCDEVVWSPDSKALAVLSRHVGRIVLVDVEQALRKRSDEGLWPRSVSLTGRGDAASNLRFVSPTRVAYLSCSSLSRVSPEPGVCTVGAMDRRLGF